MVLRTCRSGSSRPTYRGKFFVVRGSTTGKDKDRPHSTDGVGPGRKGPTPPVPGWTQSPFLTFLSGLTYRPGPDPKPPPSGCPWVDVRPAVEGCNTTRPFLPETTHLSTSDERPVSPGVLPRTRGKSRSVRMGFG